MQNESIENQGSGNASFSGNANIRNGSSEHQVTNSSIEANGEEAKSNKLCITEPENFRQCPNEDCDLRPPDFKVFGELLNRENDDLIGEGSNCIKHPDYCECAPNDCCSFCGNPIERDNKKGGVAEDPRLKAWKRELLVRRQIAKRIMKRTGKMACEILFNRRSVDDRDKIVLQRFLDHADRLPQMNHSVTKELVKHSPGGKCENYYDMPMKHMLVLPSNGEVIPLTAVEISGVPTRVRQEMYGTDCSCMPGRRWIDSKELKRSISQRRDSLKRLVEFFPDLDNLIVIGKAMTIIQGGTPDPDEVCNCSVQVVDPPVNIYADVNMMKDNTMDDVAYPGTGCALPSTTNKNDALANNQQMSDGNEATLAMQSESKIDALADNQQMSDGNEATLAMQSESKIDALADNQQISDGNEPTLATKSKSKIDELADNQQISDGNEPTLATKSKSKIDALAVNQQISNVYKSGLALQSSTQQHVSEHSSTENTFGENGNASDPTGIESNRDTSEDKIQADNRKNNQNKSKHIPSISVDVTVVTNTSDTDGEVDERDESGKNNNVHTTVYRQSFATHDDTVVASKTVANGNGIHRLSQEKQMSPKQTSPKLLSPILSVANKNASHSDEPENSRSVKNMHKHITNTDENNNDKPSQKRRDAGSSMVW